jgi:porin
MMAIPRARLALLGPACALALALPLPAASLEPGDGTSIRDIESTNFDADFSPGESTVNAEAELAEIYADNENYLELVGGKSPLAIFANPMEELYRKTGLRLGVANTMLFAQPIGGQSDLSGFGGDLDFISSWTLIGRGTENTGRFVFTGEYRYRMADQTPSLLRGQMGTLIPPVNTFNDRGWVIRDCYWIQRLWEGRIRILVGRGDISDYVGAHWLQNVNNSFANRSFSANPAMAFPGHGPMAGISLRPTDQFYLTAGAINGYSDTTEVGLETLFDEWDLFSVAETGWTPVIEGLGPGRYALAAWHMAARDLWDLPEDYGVTFIADQNLGGGWQVFARYAWSEAALTDIRNLGQGGVGRNGLFGREDDLTGLALSVADPASNDVRYETVAEIFHRFQLTRHTQFSVGLQLIANPVNAPDNETAGAFYARLRTSF